MNESSAPRFSWWRLLRLCSFQIGSAMGDILVTSIWNRIMIVNFGLPALPVGLLLSVRYLLSPLGLYAGFRSDNTIFWGYRRTSYIWLGRALMVLSLPLLALSVARFDAARNEPLGWLLASASFLLYGTGTLLSGSPFLALVRDTMPQAHQGLAASVVETALIILFAVVGISFSLALQDYSLAGFWELTLATMLIGGFFWIFAIVGIEKRTRAAIQIAATTTRVQAKQFHATLTKILADPRTRAFFVFLSVATAAAWMQEVILEPFGGQVLNATLAQTTRYSSYWQSATALVLILAAMVWRKRRGELQVPIAQIGLSIMGLGMVLLTVVSLLAQGALVVVPLLVFGVGFGLYTFGGFQLLIVMTSDAEAGAYLGLWTVTILLSRGIGISLGSALRDGLVALTGSTSFGYALVFGISALGLFLSPALLQRVNVLSFARDTGRLSTADAHVITAEL
ncbi:MAG: BCD family MFS transporter [Chloroflexi bacterium]|nr:BCD family MFS transporter [Chloroflexota bacterium]